MSPSFKANCLAILTASSLDTCTEDETVNFTEERQVEELDINYYYYHKNFFHYIHFKDVRFKSNSISSNMMRTYIYINYCQKIFVTTRKYWRRKYV